MIKEEIKEKDKELERVKRYLKRYRKKKLCIDRLKCKLADLDSRIGSIRSVTITDMPRGGVPVTIEDLIVEKADLQNRINRLNVNATRIKTEILSAIDTLDDVKEVEVLEYYLIECMNFEEIAEVVGYNTRHIVGLYSKGIRGVKEVWGTEG